jgi:hypothetical protein
MSQEHREPSIELKLGDIIELIAPTNDLLHENTFFIDYIDEQRLVIINVATLEQTQLNKESGIITDESITEINLLSRSDEAGYARQNKLVTNTWIEIHISGDISTIITGEITNLEEDQIEITTVPELDVIYIDFEYKGLPSHIPIQKIVIRDKPAIYKSLSSLGEQETEVSEDPHMEYLETGEAIIHAEETAQEEENTLELLRREIVKSKELVFGEDLEEIEQYSELPENKKRYGLELQTSSLLDELLSTIPASKRTQDVMRKIQTLIARYRELRNQFSVFDENGDVRNFRRNHPHMHKPLVDRLQKLDTKIDWILPVVSLKKKVYTAEDSEENIDKGDIRSELFDNVWNDENNIKRDTYLNDRTLADESKYYKLYQQLDDLMRPFETPIDADVCMANKEVRTNLEAIVDNIDEYTSSVMKIGAGSENIIRRKFVIQKYNLGLNKRVMQPRGAIETMPMTRPDSMCVKSLVVLPAPVMQYSRVHLPETSLLDKSNLHLFPLMLSRILHKNSKIAPFIVEDFSTELYGQDDTPAKTEFLQTMRNYILSDTLQRSDEDGKFEKFLQTIIPKTRTLIQIVKKYITQKLSFVSVVQSLEPFHIYSGDISYKQYLEIRSFIMEQIQKKKENLDADRKKFGFLTNFQYGIEPRVLSILQFVLEKPEILEQFLIGYKLPDREYVQAKMTTSEVLDKIVKIDNGALLAKLIQKLMAALMMPTSLSDLFSEPTAEDKVKPSDCNRRVLTKRYESVSELQKDNGVADIFYDKEFDDTPHHLMSLYKESQKTMLPEKFASFLAENLIQKHDCPKEHAATIAANMIRGKKLVADGEFAILVIKPKLQGDDAVLTLDERRKLADEAEIRKKTTYYYRKNGTWIHYNDIDEDAFTDTAALFCNLKAECINIKTELAEQCNSSDETARRMRQIARKKIQGEFNKRYELSAEDMTASMHNQLVEHIRYLQRLMRIESIHRERANNMAYQLGLEATKTGDAILSPHISLRDLILGQTDFVKKQNDIVRLYDQYCREPMDILSEDHGWKYCKETNSKLLPAFLYELAICYVRGGDYTLKLEEICHTHGLMSDSGNAIVDKHSGFAVRAIDFAEEDGFDAAGFKITTHAFIQKGEVEKAVENILTLYENKNEQQVCEGERAQMICNILLGISTQLGHPLIDVRDYCVRITSNLCDQLIDTEDKYNREAKKMEEKKGIILPPYKKRSQQLTVLISAVVLLTAIQTETPSFQTKKTMPGCVKSFKGFPLSGEEDMSGLHYMACVLSKMEKKFEPWNMLAKMTTPMIQEQLKKIAIAAIKHAEVDDRYLKKREYNLVHVENEIPNEHTLAKWLHFLPPLVDTANISKMTVSADLKDNFISAMKKGDKKQYRDFFAFKSKISQLSYAMIEAIQQIVKGKEVLLTTHTTNTPFVQNVCCNEKERDPLVYFGNENAEIFANLRSIRALATVVSTASAISKAPFLFDPRDTRLPYPVLSQEISEDNIYAAFISYCRLDKDIGVPSKFHAFFTDVPREYPAKGTLAEKIDFLKRHDKRFSVGQFQQLMRIVNGENIVSLEDSEKYNATEILKDLLELFDTHDSPVVDEELRQNLLRVLEKYDKTKLVTLFEDGEAPEAEKQKLSAIKTLKNGLYEMIQETFKPSVLGFLKKYGKLGKTEVGRLTDFFETFVAKWATPDLYKTANFIKTTVDEMTRIFPNILITNVTNTSRVHKYWELAQVDESRVFNTIRGYYEPLGEFRQDKVLRKLLVAIQSKFVDLRLFFEHLPIQESVRVGSRDYFSLFDKETIHLLLEYVFLSVLHEYIIATDDIELVRLDRVEQKRENRANIAENREEGISAEITGLSEEYREVYGDMMEIQIQAGNKDELKTRVAKMLIAFINIMRKNKSEIDISYETISSAIRKRKEEEKNRIVQRFKDMSEDERKVEDMKKKFKMDEWNVGTQRGIFEYDKKTSDREVREQQVEEALDIEKHGIRKADFVAIHGDTEEEPLREMVDMDDIAVEEEEDETLVSGLAGLKKNFHDGQFYSDDESDDDFGED